jgi:precorrin-6B methylase 2
VNEVLEAIFLHRYHPKPGDVIVELGASDGSETMDLAEMVAPDGLVFAVEAASHLCGNIIRRDHPNITTAIAFVDDGTHGVLLDQLTAHIPRIDLLKCNIEGSEAAVFPTSPVTLAKTSNVVVSCHDFVDVNTHDVVLAALEEAGFTVTHHDNPLIINDGHQGRCISNYLYASK